MLSGTEVDVSTVILVEPLLTLILIALACIPLARAALDDRCLIAGMGQPMLSQAVP
jgi:hypothetical protein